MGKFLNKERLFWVGAVCAVVLSTSVLLWAQSYFGYNTIGGSTALENPSIIVCTGAVSPGSNGTVTQIDLYTDTNDMDFTLAIYDIYPTNGPPWAGSLIGQSAGGQLTPGTAGWRSQSVSIPVTGGTNYDVCAWAGVTGSSVQWQLTYDSSSGRGWFYPSIYSSGNYPSSVAGNGAVSNLDMSIRAQYTPSGGGGSAPNRLTLLGVGGK